MNALATSVPASRADAAARILAAAEELFAEHGYDAVSMHAIAARAGVSKANVFHHFTSKEALYLEVLRHACRESAGRLHALGTQSGPFEQRLGSFAHAMLTSMLEHGRVQRLILRELLTDGERRGPEFAQNVFGENFARLVAILRSGQTRNELRADLDPAMVATLLIGANVFFFEAREVLRHFRDVDFAADPGRYSAMLVDILLRGIAAPPEKPKRKSTGA